MIKKLNEEKEIAHAYSSSLEMALEEERLKVRRLELQKKDADKESEAANQMVAKLKEDVKLISIELSEKRIEFEQLQKDKHTTDLELTRVKERLEEANRNSILQFILSTLATVLLAFGVNLVTTASNDWQGWMLIIAGIVLGTIAFFIARKNK
jgi:Flp pilus assembly protein TadB